MNLVAADVSPLHLIQSEVRADLRRLLRFRRQRSEFCFGKISPRYPPATILTISSRSPAFSCRWENSEGATASPLCSTTTLRGNSFCAAKNSSSEHGSFASTGFPFAMRAVIFNIEVFNHRPFEVQCSMSAFNVFILSGQRRVPILPDRLVTELADKFRHFPR